MVEDVKIIVRESSRNDDGEVRLFVDEVKWKLEEEGHTQVTGNHIEAAKVWIAFDPDVLLVMSADHVYRLDFTEVLETHRRKEAECTVVTAEVPLEEAGEHQPGHGDARARAQRRAQDLGPGPPRPAAWRSGNMVENPD